MNKIVLLVMALSLSLFSKEVTVSIVPQKFFIEQIAKDKIDVNVMVTKGFSPATYEPKTSQMRKLSTSVAYFSLGVPFEKVWLKKFQATNKKLLVIDTAAGIKKMQMQEHNHEEEHEEHGHDEGKHESHNHEGLDPHIWLDPILVKKQATNILKALVQIDAENKDFYNKNYKVFLKNLDLLNEELKTVLKSVKGKTFMVFHPSWGYFASRYNLEQLAVETEGKEPKPKTLIHLIKEAKEHNTKVLFVAPQFSKKSAQIIANSIKGNIAVLNPLSENYFDNLRKAAHAIKSSY